jgi:hypothetical protein|tara:strand:- start:313 stop:3024 length:2712 start_codon:yes stop_codon:yes gene_type:complete
MAQKTRFLDSVSVNAFGNVMPDAIITASGGVGDITFTRANGVTFTLPLAASASSADSLTTASVVDNVITFTKGDLSSFTITVDTGSGGSIPGGNGVFTQIGSTNQFQATSSLIISGSTLFETPLPSGINPTSSGASNKYALIVSESVWHRNANVGVPTTNPWKSNLGGTFFNNFDHNTDIAEMLRYMVGVLSGSSIGPDFADTTPNTKFWGNVSTSYIGQSTTTKGSLFNGVLGTDYENARLSQHWTSSAFIDFSKTPSYKEAQQYYIAKGFVQESDKGIFGNDTGTNPFYGSYSARIPSTILLNSQFSSLASSNTSVAGGSTTVSSGDSQFFGMGGLTSGGATPYEVRIIATQSFNDTYSASPDPSTSNTFTTASLKDYTISSFGTTSDGLVLGKINPPSAQIPAAFQDGKFSSVSGPITGRKYTGEATSNITISSSGYYEMHNIVVGLKTGSMSNFQFKNGSADSTVLFYTPNPYQSGFTTEGALEDITTGAPTVTVSDILTRTAFTATSRSLSGAPYILTNNYSFNYNAEVSKSFDPGYAHSTTPIQTTNPTNTWSSVGNVSLTNSSVLINSSGVNINNANAGVISFDKTTQRTVGTIPHKDDIAFLSSSLTFSLTATNNVVLNKSTQESQNYNLIFRTTGKNWKGTPQTSTSTTQNFYDSALFGQPAASGSMAIYRQAQGYDGGSLTGTTENFTGEDFRVKINSNALTGIYSGATKFTTDTFIINNLISTDLQVKPGYLVVPGSTYGYWLPTIGSSDYKYYARAFQTDGTVYSSMTINVGKSDIKNWTNTTDSGMSIGIIYQSGGSGTLSTPVLIDIADTINGDTGITTPQVGLNPFGSNINIKSNDDSIASSGNTYTISFNTLKNKQLNESNNNYIIFIRYKNILNDYLSNITVSYTT